MRWNGLDVLGTKGVDQVGLIATRKVRSRPGQIAGPNNLTYSHGSNFNFTLPKR